VPPAPANGRLDSWKEIGAYLKRDVTTVRRWEKREGLPVHRHLHDRRESVYAYPHELDRWWDERRNHLVEKTATEVPVEPSVEIRRGSRTAWVLAAALVGTTLVMTGGLVALLLRDNPRESAQQRFSELPPDGTFFGSVALSPDGRRIAFTATGSDGQSMLWVRALDSSAVMIAGTEGASFPFWSPGGQSIGFFANGSLKRAKVAGGTPQIVCEALDGRGGTWNANGTILFSPSRESGLVRVPDGGGSPTPVTTVDRPNERGHLWPQFLPDGNHFLYLADSRLPEHHNLFVGSLGAAENPKRLFHIVSEVRYTPEGYLIFAAIDGKLMARAFDATRLETAGEPFAIAAEVLQPWDHDHKADFSVSENGLLTFRGLRGLDTRLVWRDATRMQSALLETPTQYSEPSISPDQKRVAVSVFAPRPSPQFGIGATKVTSDIWIVDAESGAHTKFTFDPAAEFAPVWSPDGTRMVFSSNGGGDVHLYQKRTDGSGDEERLPIAAAGWKAAQAWSPDGHDLVFATSSPETRTDLWRLPMTTSGDRTPVLLLGTRFSEEQATISPDGRWMAYTSDESGRSEVFVRRFPSGDGKWQISTDGGGDARWRADGRELYYVADDRRLMAVSVKTGATFDRGAVTPLFDTGMRPHWAAARNHYDVSRGGQFLVMSPVVDERAVPFTIVVNWAAHLGVAER
jgi:Tol biopolymer transport system component